MDAEKQAGPGDQAGGNTHIVEAVDDMGRTVGRDAFKSPVEAEAHAVTMRAKGYRVEVSSLEPKPKDQIRSL